ncbi:MAG: pyridoxamine 5'-phosphate oxidase family protein [Spirochaetales bacterium]
MRRKDKEILDPGILEDILRSNFMVRVAWASEEGPYVLPLHYGYRSGRLYIHSAQTGRKIELSRLNPRVCFEISDSIQVLPADTPCGFSTRYRSLIGMGRIQVVSDVQEKREALSILMEQITGKTGHFFPQDRVDKVTLLRIDIESLSGKKSKI